MLVPAGINCSTSPFEGSGRNGFNAARAVLTDVVDVNALRLTSETGTPNSVMRTTEFGLAGSGGVRTNRTKSPAVEVLRSGRTPAGFERKFAKSRDARKSVKLLNPLGSA